MVYIINRPTMTELQNVSQPLIQGNFNAADSIFATEHYGFASNPPNNGLHQQVTMPLIPGGVHPTVNADPIFYTMEDSTNIGLINYSIGPIYNGYQPAPTPITFLSSNTTPISLASLATTNVLDFTGIATAIGTLYGVNWSTSAGPSGNALMTADFTWVLAAPGFKYIVANADATYNLGVTSSGNILQLKNTSAFNFNNIYWTLCFKRIVAA